MIDTKYLHMPKHTPAFAIYVADVENRLFVEAGLMPGGEEGFAFALAHRLIDVSRNCRTREGHKRLVEAAVRSLVQEHVRGFVENRKQSQMTYWRHDEPPYVGKNEDDMLVADLIAIAGQHGFAAALQFYVEHWLFEDARRLFGEQCVVVDASGSKIIEHPMRTFAVYLNQLEYRKAVDTAAYLKDAERFNAVVALRRVGLAILPEATWRQRVILGDGTLPLAEWARTAARALRWPQGGALASATGAA